MTSLCTANLSSATDSGEMPYGFHIGCNQPRIGRHAVETARMTGTGPGFLAYQRFYVFLPAPSGAGRVRDGRQIGPPAAQNFFGATRRPRTIAVGNPPEGAGITDDRTGLTVVAPPPTGTPILPAIATVTSDRKVLLIGIDGLRWDRIAGADAPVPHRLTATGTYATGAHDRVSGARTESGPGWSTLATGTSPAPRAAQLVPRSRHDRHPDFVTLARRRQPDLVGFVLVDWPPLIGRSGHPTPGRALAGRRLRAFRRRR